MKTAQPHAFVVDVCLSFACLHEVASQQLSPRRFSGWNKPKCKAGGSEIEQCLSGAGLSSVRNGLPFERVGPCWFVQQRLCFMHLNHVLIRQQTAIAECSKFKTSWCKKSLDRQLCQQYVGAREELQKTITDLNQLNTRNQTQKFSRLATEVREHAK